MREAVEPEDVDGPTHLRRHRVGVTTNAATAAADDDDDEDEEDAKRRRRRRRRYRRDAKETGKLGHLPQTGGPSLEDLHLHRLHVCQLSQVCFKAHQIKVRF